MDNIIVQNNIELPRKSRESWRFFSGFGFLSGAVVCIGLIVQLSQHDIYWNQDLAGFMALIFNYGWLGLAALLHLGWSFTTLIARRIGFFPVLGLLAGWLMIVVDIWIQAIAFQSADVQTFPTMGLWYSAFVIEAVTLATLLGTIRTSPTKRIIFILAGFVLAGATLWSIQLGRSNIAYRHQQINDGIVFNKNFKAAVDSNNPTQCDLVARIDYPGDIDACLREMVRQFNRLDLCPRLQPETLKSLQRYGKCPDPIPVATGNTKISGVVVDTKKGEATVQWNVAPAADGIINWGLSPDYGQFLSDYSYKNSHSITLPTIAGTTIHYAIRSCTAKPVVDCTTTLDTIFVAE